MTDIAHADLHCDVEASARWELPGQLLVEVRMTGRGESEHVSRWLAAPGIKAEFLSSPGTRVVAARGARNLTPGLTQNRGAAWVESPALDDGETDTAQFHVVVGDVAPGRTIGRIAVIQRDPFDPRGDVSWALTASFALCLADDQGAAEPAVEIRPATFTLSAALVEGFDEGGAPEGWTEHTTDVTLVSEVGRTCIHEPCYGEEFFRVTPDPPLRSVPTT